MSSENEDPTGPNNPHAEQPRDDNPYRLSYGHGIRLIARDRAAKMVLMGGLGGMGVGVMWGAQDDERHPRMWPDGEWDRAPERKHPETRNSDWFAGDIPVHVLKCHPEPFLAVKEGRKRHEVRVNDRNFQAGDIVELREWNPDPDASGLAIGFTIVAQLRFRIGYVTAGGTWGLPDDLCVFTLLALPDGK